MKVKFCLLFVLMVSSIAGASPQCGIAGSADLDSLYQTQQSEHNLAAISGALISGDRIVWKDAFGLKKLGGREAVSPRTLFHMGSVSKTVTLAAFMHLREQAGFSLDENINGYLPFHIENPIHHQAPITFRMLLTHTSSLNDVNVARGRNKMSGLNQTQDVTGALRATLQSLLSADGAAYSAEYFLSGKPGTEYAYSNVAYSLIGLLIEEISGISFSDYTRKHIFNPLRMDRSTFLLSEADTSDFAYQYARDREHGGAYVRVPPYTWAGYMDGSLRTTAEEYANFLIMLSNRGCFQGRQVLKAETVEAILALQDLPSKQSARMFRPVGRALLWNKVDVNGTEIYHFNGYGSGFFTEVFFSPDAKIAGLFFMTGEYESRPAMGQSISALVSGLVRAALAAEGPGSETGTLPTDAPYLGQTPPGDVPEPFAHDFLTIGGGEWSITFAPDGKELFYTMSTGCRLFSESSWLNRRFLIFHSQGKAGGWTDPAECPFTFLDARLARYPFIAPDGKRVFFNSVHASVNKANPQSSNIWYANREGDSWGEAWEVVFEKSHADARRITGIFPTVALNGNLYFAFWPRGAENGSFYVSRFANGVYGEPEILKGEINNPGGNHPFVSPDESYLIFDGERPGNHFGGGDLYISFKDESGSWSTPCNMGNTVNTVFGEARAFVSHDGRYLFFSSNRVSHSELPDRALSLSEYRKMAQNPENGSEHIYWVESSIIDQLRPVGLKMKK